MSEQCERASERINAVERAIKSKQCGISECVSDVNEQANERMVQLSTVYTYFLIIQLTVEWRLHRGRRRHGNGVTNCDEEGGHADGGRRRVFVWPNRELKLDNFAGETFTGF